MKPTEIKEQQMIVDNFRVAIARTCRFMSVLSVRTEEATKAVESFGIAYRKAFPWWKRWLLWIRTDTLADTQEDDDVQPTP